MRDKPSSGKKKKSSKEALGELVETAAAPVSFPIVAIGASAGGLEALQIFFRKMPADCEMAFVVIQHLDPATKGALAEILQRHTAMKVAQIRDGMKLEPNHVYIIPPNKNLSILHGRLLLMDLPTGKPMSSIDFFFRQLAADQQERSIGVLLSGMGSDGREGFRAIKEKLGVTLAQDPRTAAFDSMPRSAIDAGVVDYVAPPQDLPKKLIDYVLHAYRTPREKLPMSGDTLSAMQKIFILIRGRTGHDFSFYKKSSVNRRIERRLNLNQIEDLSGYVLYLERNPAEIDQLFKDLLINVTSFFRDPEAFTLLREKYLPELISEKPNGEVIRVWVPGCSTGEEAYSIAMILKDSIDRLKSRVAMQVFATDIDQDAIDRARQGSYPVNIEEDVPAEYLKRYFNRRENTFRVDAEIRETVIFATQNVIADPPFTKLDVLSCRNLLIYLTAELQKKLIPLFYYTLNPSGILFLGSSETVGSHTDLFLPLDHKWKIYRKLPGISGPGKAFGIVPALFPAYGAKSEIEGIDYAGAEPSITDVACRFILDHYAPAGLFINTRGDILFLSGRMGKYLEPRSGKADLNVYSMTNATLSSAIRNAVQETMFQKNETIVSGVKLEIDGKAQNIGFTVTPVKMTRTEGILLIVFEDREPQEAAPPPKGRKLRKAEPELEEELRRTRDRLQATIEEMQTSQEELRATNEELQSANEEMQSTNEELTSSKEEMMSLNEEVVTVNAELQARVTELLDTNSDLHNLMSSLDTAIVFLDNALKIRRFTPQISRIINLLPGDVGRPLKDLVTDLKSENIAESAKKVLDTLVAREVQVESVDGKWYLMRIIPYRNIKDIIGGVLLSFADITEMKRLAISLDESKRFAESIIETIREPLIILNGELKVVAANRAFYETFKVSRSETENKRIYDLGNRQWDAPELKKLLETIIPERSSFDGYLIEHEFPQIGRKRAVLNARRILQEKGRGELILLAIEVEK